MRQRRELDYLNEDILSERSRTKKAMENLNNFKAINNSLRDEVLFLKSEFEDRFNYLDTNLNKINGLVSFIR